MSEPGAAVGLLRNARLCGGAEPVDIVLSGGRIARVAPEGASGHGSGTTLDLDGRFVVPGLWDNHVHFTQWALTRRRLNLESAVSATDAARQVADRMRVAPEPPGVPLVGYGFRDALWPDAPTAAVLDAAHAEAPVVLISGDLHSCWLNSAALALFGYAGHPSGLLREEDSFAVVRRLDQVPDAIVDSWAREASAAAASRGVVGIVDLEMTWNLDSWTRRIQNGATALRVEFGTYSAQLDRLIGLGLRSGDVIDGTDGLLTVGPFKVITDGSLNTRTAYCFDAYPHAAGEEKSLGLLTVPTDDLIEWMARAHDAGLTCAVHAIGDHANRLALDAFQATGARGSIEHAQLLAREDFRRFADLGVTASVQPDHAMDDRDVADAYWTGRTDRAFPLASLVDAGAALALGSDAPVSPLDPWVTMAAAIWRTRAGLPSWHPEQAVSAATALRASTRSAAIAEGTVADLAVLDSDPSSADLETFRAMPVAATVRGGAVTHCTI